MRSMLIQKVNGTLNKRIFLGVFCANSVVLMCVVSQRKWWWTMMKVMTRMMRTISLRNMMCCCLHLHLPNHQVYTTIYVEDWQNYNRLQSVRIIINCLLIYGRFKPVDLVSDKVYDDEASY